MSYDFYTRQYVPPPLLDEIYAIESLKERLYRFDDFFFHKSTILHLPLTAEEGQFNDTYRVFGIIPADGWPAVFEEEFDWPRLSGILEVFRFCGQDATADAFEEARELFYNGRTDLLTLEARRQAGIRGFRRPPERKRFHALGDIVEQLPYQEGYWQLLRWPEAHRTQFVDFPRDQFGYASRSSANGNAEFAALWKDLVARKQRDPVHGLTKQERLIYAANRFRGAGWYDGFMGYYKDSTGDEIWDAHEALRVMNLETSLDLLKRAQETIFGDAPPPKGPDKVEMFTAEWSEEERVNATEELDDVLKPIEIDLRRCDNEIWDALCKFAGQHHLLKQSN